MTTSNSTRRTITLPRDPEAPINSLLGAKPEENPPDLLEQTLNRYMITIRRSMPDFTVPEWCLIFDALRPPWQADEHRTLQMAHEIADAITMDHLDQKWPVDWNKLKSRIDRLNFPARMAVGEMTEAFWQTPSNSTYEEIISDLLKVFGTPARTAQATRSNRMNLERMATIDNPGHGSENPPCEESQPPLKDTGSQETSAESLQYPATATEKEHKAQALAD